ncbi:TM2 domain-containing membrane protein YozV [Alkalibacillus filiformis]|uniref:TM2 domain-containing membrane protein YozV n=1 Tax=Alkalibacillus filiformis TaxID=200990 RepID=A0ABU0DUS1_9BACI|nr:zinc ribbon domain-containing protein [Alkalibacillus filiformis]MDQ0352208.1 TM2 domain-containing membrane protein YozV [Alkalibacillus filiformis]
MKCHKCGNQLFVNDQYCSQCGERVKSNVSSLESTVIHDESQPQTSKGKSPILALILSALVVGLGQLYAGQGLKGIVLFGVWILATIATAGMATFVIWIINLIDAYRIAKKVNQGKHVDEWEFF